MNKFKYFLIIPFFVACGGQEGNNSQEQGSNNQEIVDTTSNEVVEELIDSNDVIPNTDWVKYQLKGKVQWISDASFVLEDGEELIMSSYFEENTFDINGKQLTENLAGSGGLEPQEYEYRYNEKGQLTHRVLYHLDENNKYFEEYELKEKYFYNAEGVLVKVKMAGYDQELLEETMYKFDSDGRVVEIEVHDVIHGNVTTDRYTYEENKEIISTSINGDDPYTNTYYYNENGLVLKRFQETDRETYEVKYEYEFDELGNWTKQEETSRFLFPDGTKEDWKKSYRTTRTVKYF
jgi:hypothetical protein